MSKYNPPKVWNWEKGEGKFANINRPISGAINQKELPKGDHPIQLYSLGTPNGVKVTILLEELLEKGIKAAEYDAWIINILEGDQFNSGFVEVNPNSKIPAMVDYSGEAPVNIFESASMLYYLANKFEQFLPSEIGAKTQVMNWLFWQMGAAPYVGGGFGHFYAYAPEKFEYPINRFTMETKRQLDVLDKQLEKNEYIAGNEYSIADMAIWPWYGALVLGELYGAAEFLDVSSYKNLCAWADKISNRPAVKRGKIVNKRWGDGPQLAERHSADDFKQFDL